MAFDGICQKDLESMAILQNGRVKPLHVHASETLKYLTGKTHVGDYSPTQSYCWLSLSYSNIPLPEVISSLTTPLNHQNTRELLSDQKASSISFKDLVALKDTVRINMMKIKEDNSYRKDLVGLMNKIQLYEDITSGQNWTLPEVAGQTVNWPSFNQEFDGQSFAHDQSPEMQQSVLDQLRQMRENYQAFDNHYMLELYYAKAHLVEFALMATLAAMALLVLAQKLWPALSFLTLTLLFQTLLLAARVYISKRAPITNMYETVLFSGYGALIISSIIGHLRQEKRYLLAGLAYNTCTLMMLIFAGGMLNPQIGPLVPVLRDNFWLSTHVTTIILSYGALALSWMLANIILLQKRFGKNKETPAHMADLVYTCLKVGVVLLATGIILGGVWADYSWGRFWGWDPKETWSLIVLCLYMAILHGKSTSWIPAKRFIPLVAAAFLSVMMAWFGVNYILATGLHSYGFSEGGALFLISFFIVQITLLLVTRPRRVKATF